MQKVRNASALRPGQGRRVLIVEDEALLAFETAQVLQDAGFQVVGPATNASAAIRLARDAVIDGAVLDIDLGAAHESSGEGAAEILQSRGIPFIFVTARPRSAVAAQLRSFSLLQKPCAPDALVRVLAGNMVPAPTPAC
jgi:DNA-binding NarL/FixJ family response regulator